MKNVKGNGDQRQQGDVCFEACKIPMTAKRLDTRIVRHGESGHVHEVIEDNGRAELREEKGTTYLKVFEGTVSLVHGEHETQVFEVGEFKLLPGVFEYDYETEESKRVLD